MYPHPVAARVNADIKQTLYWGSGRWLILAALAYYLTETYALTALTGDYAVPGYPANVCRGIVLAAYYVFAYLWIELGYLFMQRICPLLRVFHFRVGYAYGCSQQYLFALRG
jgi:hypothetical protein